MGLEQHYNGQQVAELLGLDYETVLHLAQIGEVATVRVGRRRLFPESAVNAYLIRNRELARNVLPLRRIVESPNEEAR